MNFLKHLLKTLTPTNESRGNKYIINDGNKTPEKILSIRKYLKDFNAKIETVDNVESLVVTLPNESRVDRLRRANFAFDQSATQVIYDSKFVEGISGYIYLLR